MNSSYFPHARYSPFYQPSEVGVNIPPILQMGTLRHGQGNSTNAQWVRLHSDTAKAGFLLESRGGKGRLLRTVPHQPHPTIIARDSTLGLTGGLPDATLQLGKKGKGAGAAWRWKGCGPRKTHRGVPGQRGHRAGRKTLEAQS